MATGHDLGRTRGRLYVGLGASYESADRAISRSHQADNPDLESTVTRAWTLQASYDASRRVGLDLLLRYQDVRSPKTIGGDPAKEIHRHYEGLGDLVALSSVQLLPERLASRQALSLLAGLRLPTGDDDPDHRWKAADGSMLSTRDAVLQPGHGTFDPIVGLRYGRRLPRGLFHASALHRKPLGRSDHGYAFGSETQVTVGTTQPLGKRFDLTLAVDAVDLGRDTDYRGVGLRAATGGNWMYFAPRLSWRAPKQVTVDLQLLWPFYEHSNGNILSPDGSVALTVGRTFDLRRRDAVAEEAAAPARDVPVISRGEEVDVSRHLVEGKLTLVHVHSDRCGACRALAPRLAGFLARHPEVAVRKVDVTSGGPVLAQLGVVATPELRLHGPDGALLLRTNTDLAALERIVEARRALR